MKAQLLVTALPPLPNPRALAAPLAEERTKNAAKARPQARRQGLQKGHPTVLRPSKQHE